MTRQRVELGPRMSRLVVEAKDAALRMTLARASRVFADQTEADILTGLVAGWPGLSPEVRLTGGPVAQLVQHQCSDWDFLVMRAEAAGALVTVVDGRVTVAPPVVAGAAVAQAVFGQGLREASLELDAEGQPQGVTVQVWDPGTQAMLEGTAADAPLPGPGDIDGAALAATGGAEAALAISGARDAAAAAALAGGAMLRARLAAVRGSLTVQGTGAVLPGLLVDLAGLGARFNGLALVTGVRHRLGRGDWRTEVLLGQDPRAHAERFAVAVPPAAAAVAPAGGLQVALVAALEGDPAGEGRVQVRLPGVTLTEGALWARLARPDAGPDRGTCFLPEIGDEVVLGFLDGDPRDPVILGALHSSARATPLTAADDNHEKALVTRSGMRIHWNDDTVTCRIETPEGYALVLSEEEASLSLADKHGNSLVLSDKGIALDSVKDIVLTAKGDVKVEGKALALKAQAKAAVEGGSAAELKAGGTVTVKGATVMIN